MALRFMQVQQIEQEYEEMRHEPYYRERLNPFEYYNETEFLKRYRFTKVATEELIRTLQHQLERATARSHAVPVHLQVTAALQFYATGTFQMTVGDTIHLSQPTMSRIIRNVSVAIAVHSRQYIKYPEHFGQLAVDFQDIAGFPNVTGAIDCTHVKIPSPGGDNAETYRNRKGYFSLNVQAICDANMKIMDLVARWQGSTHDSRIFNESRIKERYEAGEIPGYLVGDSGYACKTYLMTPINNREFSL